MSFLVKKNPRWNVGRWVGGEGSEIFHIFLDEDIYLGEILTPTVSHKPAVTSQFVELKFLATRKTPISRWYLLLSRPPKHLYFAFTFFDSYSPLQRKKYREPRWPRCVRRARGQTSMIVAPTWPQLRRKQWLYLQKTNEMISFTDDVRGRAMASTGNYKMDRIF
jgi:hypothetical protein